MDREDHLIDRVARQMTEAEPPADFRVRVIANLPSARRAQPWWHVAALAGGGILLGMLIMTVTRTHVGSSGHSGSALAVSPKGPLGPGRALGPGAAAPVSTSNAPLRVGSAEPKGPRGPIGPEGPDDALESAFPLLSIVPIQPSELSIAPIVVGPIVTGSIALPPIVK